MPPFNAAMGRSGSELGLPHPIGFLRPARPAPWARTASLVLALWVPIGAAGCGGGAGGPESPERKEKQAVVQDKMKEFMKKANLPNRR